ncbi:hypothetical protein JB92DRAFT_2692891 [Gautieria morchelliformis]|nr:hypothetical protein JB92DRAFT_2692891 [Gautieria morchelliformis]
MSPSKVTILGGGITGLSAAFHLSRKFPSTRITLLEKSNRLGGWVHSKRVQFDIPGGDIGSAVLELGPRTLRPQSKALLEMAHYWLIQRRGQVNLLDLTPHLIGTPASSPAARNRFLYLSDSQKPGLTLIPSTLLGHLTSRLSLTTIPPVIREPFRSVNRPQTTEGDDESFDSILSRRFGPELARVLGSSVIHGIYATDSRNLSVKSAMAPVWEAERRGNGSIVRGLYRSRSIKKSVDTEIYETAGLEQSMKGLSVYSFRCGVQMLADALKEKLESLPNVNLQTGSEVKSIRPLGDSYEVSTSFGPIYTSHLVSTIPLATLHPLLTTAKLPHLRTNPSSSVTVVTFVFASPPSQIHPPGFGYLIPRPKGGYEHSTNPEGVLGVVFDSCSVDEQDQPRGQLTKLTMMLGGPYPQIPQIGDTASLGLLLLGTLERHFGRSLPRPAHVEVTHNQHCIPVPTPGHLHRMGELREALGKDPWNGRLEIVGAGVGGVSVADCVEQGRNVGKEWESQR